MMLLLPELDNSNVAECAGATSSKGANTQGILSMFAAVCRVQTCGSRESPEFNSLKQSDYCPIALRRYEIYQIVYEIYEVYDHFMK